MLIRPLDFEQFGQGVSCLLNFILDGSRDLMKQMKAHEMNFKQP
jgi:hypothetical protein